MFVDAVKEGCGVVQGPNLIFSEQLYRRLQTIFFCKLFLALQHKLTIRADKSSQVTLSIQTIFYANKTPRVLQWDALATERGIERNRAGTLNYLDQSVRSAEEISVENFSVVETVTVFAAENSEEWQIKTFGFF